MNNLSLPRPEAWRQGALFPFIEECWSNTVGVVGNNNIVASRLTAIDAIFEETHHNLKPAKWTQIVPALLMLRAFSAFRAGVMVAMSLPADSYPLQRSCLESAGYARLIASETELGAMWLQRDDEPKLFRQRFTNGAVRNAIAANDDRLATIYQELYERSIDFGAHPNEKGVLSNVLKESVGTGTLQFWMLAGDGPPLQHALRTCAQIGICSLRVLNLVFAEQFAKHNFNEKIEKASVSF
jgi:hypothetical protein